jgi:NAD(P)-dependent dehydrogenase (short-subunit alcohol dehydrogenase family)
VIGAEARQADPTSFDEVAGCIDSILEAYGPIQGVANCVGSLLLKPAHLTNESDWLSTLQINLTSAFAVLRAAAKAMTSSGGSIVLVSSSAARIGLPNHEAIAAAKAGVIGLTLSAAASYAPKNIRVNCVAPGLVRTEMTRRLTDNEGSLKASLAMHALGRIGEPSDVASAIEWFLSPEQSWVTGQVLGVDGGLGSLRGR